MRCDCCNARLTEYEATLRHAVTNEFVDTCQKCLTDLNIPTRGRPDLNPFEEDTEDEFFPDSEF
jgi:hypothetical protein